MTRLQVLLRVVHKGLKMEHGYVVLVGSRAPEQETSVIRKHGYRVLLINTHVSLKELCLVDRAIEADLNDSEGITRQIAALLQDGMRVVSVLTQNEYRTGLAAKIATLAGTFFLSEQAAVICRNKSSVRNALRGTPLDTVPYVVNENIRALLSDTEGMDFPVVAKPENDAGSNHVYICRNTEELWDAVSIIGNLKTNHVLQAMGGRTLIERYLEGREFSVEALSDGSSTRVIAVTEKFTQGSVEKAHLVPARISPEERSKINSFVSSLHEQLGIRHAVTHTEIKLHNGVPGLIEINGRTGGDNIADLVRLTSGLDLFEAALLLSLGYSVNDVLTAQGCVTDSQASAMSIFLFAAEDGYVSYKSCPYPVQRAFPAGSFVTRTTSNYTRLGSYIISSASPLDPLVRITESDEYVSVERYQ